LKHCFWPTIIRNISMWKTTRARKRGKQR